MKSPQSTSTSFQWMGARCLLPIGTNWKISRTGIMSSRKPKDSFLTVVRRSRVHRRMRKPFRLPRCRRVTITEHCEDPTAHFFIRSFRFTEESFGWGHSWKKTSTKSSSRISRWSRLTTYQQNNFIFTDPLTWWVTPEFTELSNTLGMLGRVNRRVCSSNGSTRHFDLEAASAGLSPLPASPFAPCHLHSRMSWLCEVRTFASKPQSSCSRKHRTAGGERHPRRACLLKFSMNSRFFILMSFKTHNDLFGRPVLSLSFPCSISLSNDPCTLSLCEL